MPSAAGVSRLGAAVGLALAAAVSLGLSRFAYALLVTPMRADLGWSYFTAGAMNTANAAGYLVGALAMPALLRRFDARALMLGGGFVSAALLAAHGLVRGEAALLTLRLVTGAASAASFVAGGLLAARLASQAGGARVGPGLVLGLYYGGVGLGIVAATAFVPPLRWPSGWMALGAASLGAGLVTAWSTRGLVAPPQAGSTRARAPWRRFLWALAGYGFFGLGYIGYITFVVTLLREQGVAESVVLAFYALLGLGVIVSSWLWSGLLQRWRGGQTLALLNALLALATLLPVLSRQLLWVWASGLLFGAVVLSLVASTTAFVRHNLPEPAWPAGITLFTIVFATGQIVGPSLVGWVADGEGGLLRGFAWSAALLAAGAAVAACQRALTSAPAAADDAPIRQIEK